jgi:acyl-coenzyme A thioesterase PaaI-like protein
MPVDNMLRRALAPLDHLPAEARTAARSRGLAAVVPFTGTAGLLAEKLDDEGAVFYVANERRVQNHIQGVHAAASALLAETATGLAFGWHLPEGKLPLLKSMKIDYVARATGGLRAEARLDAAQIAQMQAADRGAIDVAVTVTDEAGQEPVRCTMTWAWVSKR